MSGADFLAVAVAQFAPGDDRKKNLGEISVLLSEAVSWGAELVLFPEYSSFFTAQMGVPWLHAAEPLDGEFATSIAQLAAEYRVHIVAGMLESIPDEPSRVYNTTIALSPQGTRLAYYRKIHLYDAFGGRESDWIAPGPLCPPQTFAIKGFSAGLQCCYDLRFPESTRRLVDAGVNLVLVPSEWVPGALKAHAWRTLLQARAIENTVFVAAADHPWPSGVGESMIVDPMGVSIAALGESTAVTLAHLDIAQLEAVRVTNPALALRRLTGKYSADSQ